MIDILELSKSVLRRLITLDFEKEGGDSSEQLIFPMKQPAKGKINRVSEQELRLLFIEEFKSRYPDLFYSIETPTSGKYNFKDEAKEDSAGQSASHDMCIFKRESGKYRRILNVEFKHRNSDIKKSAKDILKLIYEEHDGVFIHLLENTNKNTLYSIFQKLHKSFVGYQSSWRSPNKSIELIILSLRDGKLIYAKLHHADLQNLEELFSIERGSGNIVNFSGNRWVADKITEVEMKALKNPR